MKNKSVLITGGAGFIGSHLAERLIKEGYRVFVLDDFSTGRMENINGLLNNERFHLKIGSVLDKLTLEELIDEVDVIFHLAAAVGVKYIMENPLKSLIINIQGTENVLEIANKGKKLTFIASTSEVYGKNENVPLKEADDRILGNTYISRWGYAASKAVDEFLALAYYREKKLPVIIMRFFNTCGPRQVGHYGMVVPKFVKAALLNQPITVYGDGSQARCFTYIDDVIECLFRLLHCKEAIGEVINIGSDQLITIKELAEKVKRVANSASPIEFRDPADIFGPEFEDMKLRKPDVSKLYNLIGFKPSTDIDEILLKIISYFES